MGAVPSSLGKRLRKLREGKGLTQVQLAQTSGLSQGHISRLEKGPQTPTLQTLQRIRSGLALTDDEFQSLVDLAARHAEDQDDEPASTGRSPGEAAA